MTKETNHPKKLNFTKASVEALPTPDTGRVYYYDFGGSMSVKGLTVCVSSTSGRVFYSYRKVNGKPERIKIGNYTDLTVDAARKAATDINSSVGRGGNPNERKRDGRAELTLGELFDEYLKNYANGKKTAQDMRDNFARYLGEVPDLKANKHGKKRVKAEGSVNWQNKKLSAITTLDVQKLHSDLGVKCGKATANRTLELLRAIINKGASWKLFKGENPCENITKFSLQSRERYIQGDEMKRFNEAVADEPNETIRDYIFMSLATGARKANVLAMRWGDVVSGVWTIPEEKTKNGEPAKVQLTELAKEILERREKTKVSDFVFAGDGVTGHLTSPKRAWARILERAELKNLTLHDLRRTNASWLVNTGASLQLVGAVLGHKDAKSTAVYARLNDDVIRAAMETAQKAMLTAGGITPKAEVLEFKKSNGK